MIRSLVRIYMPQKLCHGKATSSTSPSEKAWRITCLQCIHDRFCYSYWWMQVLNVLFELNNYVLKLIDCTVPTKWWLKPQGSESHWARFPKHMVYTAWIPSWRWPGNELRRSMVIQGRIQDFKTFAMVIVSEWQIVSDDKFPWWNATPPPRGGGDNCYKQKIMCAVKNMTKTLMKCPPPGLSLGGGGGGTKDYVRACIYLSLIFKHSDTKWDKNNTYSRSEFVGGRLWVRHCNLKTYATGFAFQIKLSLIQQVLKFSS